MQISKYQRHCKQDNVTIDCVSFLQHKVYQAELKITIVFACYLAFIFVVLCEQAVVLAWKDSFRNETNRYFLCEAVGHTPGRCNLDSLKKYSHVLSLMSVVLFIVDSFIPVSHLVFIINCRVVKKTVQGLGVVKTLMSSLSKRSSEQSSH